MISGSNCADSETADKPKPKEGSKKKALTQGGEVQEEEEIEEAAGSEKAFVSGPQHRFVLHLLNYLYPLLSSNEKAVRYRTSQLLSLLLSNTLTDFPFDFSEVAHGIFMKVRSQLGKRMKDKEAVVRVQAAIGVVRLMEMGVGESGSEDEDEEDEVAGSTKSSSLFLLIDSMQNDPSS